MVIMPNVYKKPKDPTLIHVEGIFSPCGYNTLNVKTVLHSALQYNLIISIIVLLINATQLARQTNLQMF